MKKNWQVIFCVVFIGIGSIFALVGGLMGFNSWKLLRVGLPVAGEVISMIELRSSDGSLTYSPQVTYMDNEGKKQTWTSGHSTNPPCCAVGDQVTLLVNPSNPKRVSINTFGGLWSTSLIFGGLGLLFFIIGGITAINLVKHKQRDAWLINNGKRIEADFSTIGEGNVEVNGQVPWVVICQWQNPANGEMMVFTSDNIWFDPSNYVAKGQKIGVLVDPNNFKTYHVDLSFLPKVN